MEMPLSPAYELPSYYCNKIPYKKELKGGRAHSGSQFKATQSNAAQKAWRQEPEADDVASPWSACLRGRSLL